jgi:hypothetical protein
LGAWFNAGALIFLMAERLWILPGGLGFLPDWRITGDGGAGDGFFGNFKRAPATELEAFLMLAACLAWLYAVERLVAQHEWAEVDSFWDCLAWFIFCAGYCAWVFVLAGIIRGAR